MKINGSTRKGHSKQALCEGTVRMPRSTVVSNSILFNLHAKSLNRKEERSSYLVELLLVATVQEQKERARKRKPQRDTD